MARTLIAATVATVLSMVALKFLPAPFIWASALWLAVCVLGLVVARRRGVKLCYLCVAAALATLGGAETWQWIHPGVAVKDEQLSRPLYQPDSLLGWRLAPGMTRATQRLNEALVYDVTYTVDSSSRRVMPPDTSGPEGCVLFFADSYVFGRGLNDRETLPYLVALRTTGRFRVFNLSVPGYGAEQMLAAIEHGRLSQVPCRPTHVIYSAIVNHALRASGRMAFSRRGPHYEIGPAGIPEYHGTPWPDQRIQQQLEKSRLYQVLTAKEPSPSDDNKQRYLAIVSRARDLLVAQYPGIQFHILVWHAQASRFRECLATVTRNLHLVDGILPGYLAEPRLYQLGTRDHHPNARANAVLAEYVVTQILTATTPPAASAPAVPADGCR
jgi:hypothetical protein